MEFNSNRSKEEKIRSAKKVPESIKLVVSWGLRQGFSITVILKLIRAGKSPFDVGRIIAQRKMGLRVNSIIGNPLYFPDSQNNNATLKFQNATAGRWNAYDFKHKRNLKLSDELSHYLPDIDLMFFPIEDLASFDKNIETPEGFLDIFKCDHLVHFTQFSVQRALDYGAIEEVTYGEAYKKLKRPEFIRDVNELGIKDQSVYQVTPKGSTLILPSRKGGDKTPPLKNGSMEKEREGLLQPIRY